MSCDPERPTFRLLDRLVGWTDDGSEPQTDPPGALTRWDDPEGLRLSYATPGAKAMDPRLVLAYLPPRVLARGPARGAWLLLTPDGRVLRRDPCPGDWLEVWSAKDAARDPREPDDFEKPVALDASPNRFAVAFHDEVQVWTVAGEKKVAALRTGRPSLVATMPCDGWLVALDPGSRSEVVLRRYGPAGDFRGEFLPLVTQAGPMAGPVDRMAVDAEGVIWVLTGPDEASWQLWRGTWGGEFRAATTDELAGALPPTGLTAATAAGFCLREPGPDGIPVTRCWSWDGGPPGTALIAPPPKPAHTRLGRIASGPIDSGIPRCRWHRVRIDADVPPGTSLQVSTATYEPGEPFATGLHGRVVTLTERDWKAAPEGALDVLIDLPPGRFLFLRLDLRGDGTATPVVRRVRLDFPRRTSLSHLPAVYRESPEAEEFAERFLANFDATIEDLDRAIERFPALLDVGRAPGEVLPWLGRFLDAAFDPDWDDAKRRRILAALPALFKQRGTVAGLSRVIREVLGIDPVILEGPEGRSWGALAGARANPPDGDPRPLARLGVVRLFGTSRARFRLGHSALGGAPLRGYGDPDLDPLDAEAFRFQVLVARTAPLDRDRLAALIEAQKPAHTAMTFRVGGDGFVVGVWSTVGVDTAFTPLPAPVLGGSGNVRLGRASLVAAGPRRGRLALAVGRSSAVGVHTLLE